MEKSENSDAALTPDQAFLAQEVFPDAAQAFSFYREELALHIDECDIVVDTNVLLLPYRAGPGSLAEIGKVFSVLRDAGRLFVPGQVAREFARNQPKRLGELFAALLQQSSQASAPKLKKYPLLESTPEYQRLLDAAEMLREAKNAYTAATGEMTEVIRRWGGNDPVSEVFRSLFTAATVRDIQPTDQATLDEMRRRYKLKIPPGYKDSPKPDGGIGDYIIWLTILAIGKDRKKPVVFVTGEEKNDWHERAANVCLVPRYELVDEFRRASNGHAFYIIQLSELLTLLKAEDKTVAEVRKEEEREREAIEEQLTCPECGDPVLWRIRRILGSSARPRCGSCGGVFHAHRTSGGVIVRRPGERIARREGYGFEEVTVRCPTVHCGAKVTCEIGLNLSDSAHATCAECGLRFHAHRSRDGSVFGSLPGRRHGEAISEDDDA
ncbi:MAG: hypothetical protein EVA89_13145 [Sandaracinaceae bacterium]|nr:MAG: hypothetical protein EVA89_13145 [Sandaracinaceae bacterium]